MLEKKIILTCLLLSFIFGLSEAHGKGNKDSINVTLLGTGTPGIDINRFGASTLVEAGGKSFLFDAGRGAAIRISQVGNPRKILPKLTQVFLTHLHSDHLMGLSDIYMTGWVYGRKDAINITGPVGAKGLMTNLRESYERDIYYRSEIDTKYATTGLDSNVNEISTDQIVYNHKGVKITAFLVDHADIKPAFGYKVEYKGKSVVISGDTRYSTNLIKYAKGTDLLIHEVAQVSSAYLKKRPSFQKIIDHHTTPFDAGKVFEKVKPKLAVFSHVIKIDISEQDLLTEAGKSYSGRLLVGQDLMTINISDVVDVVPSEAEISARWNSGLQH